MSQQEGAKTKVNGLCEHINVSSYRGVEPMMHVVTFFVVIADDVTESAKDGVQRER